MFSIRRRTVENSPDLAVVHEQPRAEAERMAVRAGGRCARRRADVGEEGPRRQLRAERQQVLVRPGRRDLAIDAGDVAVAIPAEAEAVAVRRRLALGGVQRLVDERPRRLGDDFLEPDGRARISDPATHAAILGRGSTRRGPCIAPGTPSIPSLVEARRQRHRAPVPRPCAAPDAKTAVRLWRAAGGLSQDLPVPDAIRATPLPAPTSRRQAAAASAGRSSPKNATALRSRIRARSSSSRKSTLRTRAPTSCSPSGNG